MLNVIRFIKDNDNWEKLLNAAPYHITVSRDRVNDRNLILLKYKQTLAPDFSNPIVKECRGLILDEDTLEPVSVPFYKFGNYGEPWVKCDEIDWTSPSTKVYEKIDGSLIKLSLDKNMKLLISTNGTIDAYKAPISAIGCPYETYGSLVEACILKQFGMSMEQFCKKYWLSLLNYTIMLELTSPWTTVVVPYNEPRLWIIGGRDHEYLDGKSELSIDVLHRTFDYKFYVPKQYDITSLADAIEKAKDKPWTDEGFVVVDYLSEARLKIKGPEYLRAHHLRGEGVLGKSRAIEIVLANEIDEMCVYFPQYQKPLDNIKSQIEQFEIDMEKLYAQMTEHIFDTRKDNAMWILNATSNLLYREYLFDCTNATRRTAHEYIIACSITKLVKFINFKMDE